MASKRSSDGTNDSPKKKPNTTLSQEEQKILLLKQELQKLIDEKKVDKYIETIKTAEIISSFKETPVKEIELTDADSGVKEKVKVYDEKSAIPILPRHPMYTVRYPQTTQLPLIRRNDKFLANLPKYDSTTLQNYILQGPQGIGKSFALQELFLQKYNDTTKEARVIWVPDMGSVKENPLLFYIPLYIAFKKDLEEQYDFQTIEEILLNIILRLKQDQTSLQALSSFCKSKGYDFYVIYDQINHITGHNNCDWCIELTKIFDYNQYPMNIVGSSVNNYYRAGDTYSPNSGWKQIDLDPAHFAFTESEYQVWRDAIVKNLDLMSKWQSELLLKDVVDRTGLIPLQLCYLFAIIEIPRYDSLAPIFATSLDVYWEAVVDTAPKHHQAKFITYVNRIGIYKYKERIRNAVISMLTPGSPDPAGWICLPDLHHMYFDEKKEKYVALFPAVITGFTKYYGSKIKD